jgi:hypothetical protein
VRHPAFRERRRQGRLGSLPILVAARVLLRRQGVPDAQLHLRLVETVVGQEREAEVENPVDLGLHLIGAAEQVRVVLGKAAHAQQPPQRARGFVAVDGPELRVAHGQVAVAARSALEDQHVKRAVHGLEVILLVLDLDRRVHAFLVPLQVPARLPQPRLSDVGRGDEVVAAGAMPLPPVVLHDRAHQSAPRMEQGQPRPGLGLDAEQVELGAEATVVPFLLLAPPEVALQLSPVRPDRAVDALEHPVLLAPAPVRPGDIHQLEAVGRDLPRVFEVGPQAKVLERVVPVRRDGAAAGTVLTVLVLTLCEVFYRLQLVRLVLEELAGLVGVQDPAPKGVAARTIRRIRPSISGKSRGVRARGRSKS